MIGKILTLLTAANLTTANISIDTHTHEAPTNTVCSEADIMPISNQYNIDNMNYYWGYSRGNAGSKSSGYMYFDYHSYYSDFTNNSRLYLINVKTYFTSGYIATQNNESGFSDMYDLDKGYVHLTAVDKFTDSGDISSSVKLLATWPESSTTTMTISSSFGGSLTSNWSNGSELDWPNGAKISIGRGYNASINFTYTKTTTSDEPVLSSQTSPSNSLEQQWNYQYKGLGRTTYIIDAYYLLEVKDDAVGFDKYGFVFDLYLNMANVKWKNYWWESHDSVEYSLRTYMGLGRNPSK